MDRDLPFKGRTCCPKDVGYILHVYMYMKASIATSRAYGNRARARYVYIYLERERTERAEVGESLRSLSWRRARHDAFMLIFSGTELGDLCRGASSSCWGYIYALVHQEEDTRKRGNTGWNKEDDDAFLAGNEKQLLLDSSSSSSFFPTFPLSFFWGGGGWRFVLFLPESIYGGGKMPPQF